MWSHYTMYSRHTRVLGRSSSSVHAFPPPRTPPSLRHHARDPGFSTGNRPLFQQETMCHLLEQNLHIPRPQTHVQVRVLLSRRVCFLRKLSLEFSNELQEVDIVDSVAIVLVQTHLGCDGHPFLVFPCCSRTSCVEASLRLIS